MEPSVMDVICNSVRAPERCRTITAILARIGDKWSVLVVVQLRDGPLRFSELKRGLGSISQRMLTLTLRGLERDGIVSRHVTPSIPLRVDYELTELGRSLEPIVETLAGWAIDNHAGIVDTQVRFDNAQRL